MRSNDSLSREPGMVTDSCEASRNAHVKAIDPSPERASKLFEVLKLPLSKLTPR